MILKKGDLVYLPSDIMLIDNTTVKKWIKLDEPTLAVMVELVRTIDTMEVMSRA
jgi:hypothetical protein